ncbi:MAG: alpha/beta hydrolase [Rhodobacteraceae bacterium]|nr:alpha/beta hydrolase [Paracoccaceae bacterium]
MTIHRTGAQALYARHYGTGPRKALALHCSLAHSGAWRGVADRLSDTLSITALDLPGHGQSPAWSGDGDLVLETLEAVLPFVTEPVDLIGHSFGGVLSLLIALERPEMVRSLSLFEPVLMAVSREEDHEEHKWNQALMDKIDANIAAGEPDKGARAFLRVWGDGRPWDKLPDDLRESATRLIPFISASQPMLADDAAGIIPRLGSIDIPCVLMRGETSPDLMRVVQNGLAAKMPRARRVCIAGAGHMGPITHPAEVATEIRKTLSEAE